MRSLPLIAGRAALALVLLIAPFASTGGAAKKRRASVTVRKIGPGAYYKKIVKPRKRLVIHVINVNPVKRSSVDVGLAGDELGHLELLSSLAARKGAIAAINGDFGTREKRPWNMYAEDGHFIQTERTWGRALAVNVPEDEIFVGHPKPKVKLLPKNGTPIEIERVNNGRPESDEVALFTRLARKVERPPRSTCSARLAEKEDRRFNASGAMSQRFDVVAVRCDKEPMPTYGKTVVSARRLGRGPEIKALTDGQVVKLTWRLPGIDHTADVMGGNPLIVADSRAVQDTVRDCGYLCELHPRTGVGLTPNGRLMFVVVDGRRPGARGMYLYELARWFVNNGAERAITLDGGGASEMWIRGRVVNMPSDGHERPLVNALLLLPGRDAGQPVPGAPPPPVSPLDAYSPTTEIVEERAFEDSAADPGSLGGLADFLERRGKDLPPWMERVAEDLRAGRRDS